MIYVINMKYSLHNAPAYMVHAGDFMNAHIPQYKSLKDMP